MKKLDLGQTLGILANVGVLTSILLLVYELNQNRQMMAAQTRNAIADTLIQILSDEADNPVFQNAEVKIAAGERLSPLEERQVISRRIARFRYWENVYYQYRQGLFDDNEYIGQRESWRRILSDARAREHWCRRANVHSEQFLAEINALLGETGCN